jgi:predicted XRE-type DNA-binding protein
METITEGGDNIFADLRVPNADEELLKAQLAHRIRTFIAERGLTQAQAAARMGTDQPKVSQILGAKLSGLSAGRLVRYLNALGCDVEIAVSPTEDGSEGTTRVVAA